MTVTATAATAATYTELRNKVRRAAGDSDAQRWSDTEVDEVLDYQMAEMFRAMSINPASVLAKTDVTYTADADELALAEAVASGIIYKVEDITAPTRPKLLLAVGLNHIEAESGLFEDIVGTNQYVWSLRERNLVVRRKPSSDLSLRIHYVPAPYVITGTAGDQHPFPVQHEEYLVIGAANRLRYVDSEVPPEHLMHYAQLREDFIRDAEKNKAPKRARARHRRHRFL